MTALPPEISSLPLAPIAAGIVAFGAAILLGSRILAPTDGPLEGGTDSVESGDAKASVRWIPQRIRASLDSAGLMEPDRQIAFVVVHALAIVLGGIIAIAAASRMESSMAATIVVAAGLLVGWWLPTAWLVERQVRRREEISADFPMMLDLLEIALAGGLGLPAAWAKVKDTIRGSSDPLAVEMRRIELDVDFGSSWAAALDRAAERTGVAGFRALASLFGQSERFGTELTRVMVVLSDSLRLEASQALEERAHVASVRLLVPLGALLFPATVIILVGPLFLMLFETLQNVNAD